LENRTILKILPKDKNSNHQQTCKYIKDLKDLTGKTQLAKDNRVYQKLKRQPLNFFNRPKIKDSAN